MKTEEKEAIIDIRLTQIDANEDFTEAQISDPILTKIRAANCLPEMRYQQKVFLQNYTGHNGTV